jgi:hypothetical protein
VLLVSFGKNPLEIGTPDGFCEMIKCSQSDGLDSVGAIGKSGKHNHGDYGLCFAQKFDSWYSRHFKVKKRRVHVANQLERFLRAARLHDVMTEIPDWFAQRFTKWFVIVNDQDSRHGRRISNRGPIARFVQQVVPQRASTISRAEASPGPVPLLNEKTGSKIFPLENEP